MSRRPNGTKFIRDVATLREKDIASVCDHTFVSPPEAFKNTVGYGSSPVRKREKALYKFLSDMVREPHLPYAVCVRPEDVFHVVFFLQDTGIYGKVKVASVAGFPDGSVYSAQHKILEAKLALDHGAHEIDVCADWSALRKGHRALFAKDVREVTRAIHAHNGIVKLIIETSELSHGRIVEACDIAELYGVDFIKTSTGYSAHGARADSVRVIRRNFTRGVKISGGVNRNNVKDLLVAASRYDSGKIELHPDEIRVGESDMLYRHELGNW